MNTMRWILVLALLALAGCDDGSVMGADRGRLGEDEGCPLRPVVLPWEVTPRPTVTERLLRDAVDWWQEQAGRDGVPRDWFVYRQPWELTGEGQLGVVQVGEEELPHDQELGDATLIWNEHGEILSAHVRVSPRLAGDDARYREVLKHELGHCLGLADDGPEVHSVMSDPTPEAGELTEADFERLTEDTWHE